MEIIGKYTCQGCDCEGERPFYVLSVDGAFQLLLCKQCYHISGMHEVMRDFVEIIKKAKEKT